MKTFYSYLKSLFVLIFILSSVNSFAQSDEVLSITKVPGDNQLFKELSKEKKNPPPESNSPSIIRNVPGDYATIQAAINAAAIGDIVLIAAGTYREDITLNKYLKIRGANYGINPNTSIRMPETVIQPGTSDPDANTYFYIGANGSGSIIDGITFDGNNDMITSGVVINGIDVDAAEAIGAYDGLSNTTISNNIIKNLNYAGIDLYNYYNSGAATFDNLITDNLFDNIIPTQWGIAVLIYNNCYTSITNNVMTRVRIGIQTGNFYSADLGTGHTISGNTVESYRTGIFHNLTYTNATSFIITNNVFTTVAGAPNNNGIVLSSIGSSVGVTVTNNNVSDARAGYNLWNCTTTNTVTVTGGVLTNCKTGVFANNYDGYSSNADPSVYAMTGVTMTNCDTGIWVRDNNLNTNGATVALNINNTTNYVNGSGIGLVVEGGDASVTFSAGDPIDFNTSLSKYIRLITNGSNVPSANINAQDVKFGGTKGSGLTDAQLFTTEDKIDHKIDWSSLGFVSVKNNNDYVTVNSFYTPNTSTPSVQRGIEAASSGYTVNVAAGTYVENITVNKSNLILRGPNYGINPNTGSRGSEAIIMPAVDDPELGVLVTLQQSNFTMDGFLLNGDNPSLNSGYSVGGADVNTSEGICNGLAIGPFTQIDHIDIQNNIFNNFDYQAVYLEVAFNSNHSWNYVKNNKFYNMWEGVQTYALHTDISYNTFTGVDRALSMHGVHAAADGGFTPQIAFNTVSITWKTGYSRNIGIWVNYRDGNAPALDVKNNTINCSDASLIGKNFYGFYALTLKDERVVTFSDNTITGAGNCSRGFYMSNCPSSNVTLSGGSFNNIRDYGIFMTNYDASWGPGASRLTVNNLPVTMNAGSTAGAWVYADNSYTNNPTNSNSTAKRSGRKDEPVTDKTITENPNSSPSAMLATALNISNSTLNGASTGIMVTGTLASANIHDNPSTITGAVIGIDVDGGTAAIYRNNITANGTGVRVKNSGNLDSITENFITSNTADGINIESTAGTIGIVSNNDLSGNTGYGIKYSKPTPSLYANCNWYGSALAAAVAAEISGNVNYITFLTNGTDNDGGTNGFQLVPGSCNGLGPVLNVTQNISYPSIQPAINAANNGDIIEVSPGTYNEQVLVNKQVVIKGVGATKPVVDFTGTVSGKPTIFDVSVPNVTLENMRIRVDMTKLNSGVIASATDIDNINIKNDSIEAYGSSNAVTFGSYGNRNAISINYGGTTNYRVAAGGVDNISVTGNTVSGVLNDGFGVARYFRSGVSFDEGGGVFNNNTLQTINHDLLGRFGSNGNIEFKNNLFIGGGIELADMNAGAGVLTISDNTFDATFANSSAPGSAVLRLKNNYNSKTTLVNRNTLINHQWGVSLENYNTVTLDSNTFTPLASSTIYHHIAINTKSITTNSNAILQVTTGAVLTRNTFNNSGTPGGTALSFHNHDNDAASIGTFTVGTTGNENNFKNGIANFIYLDGQTGASSGSTFPDYNLLIGAGAPAITTMACWSTDVNIEQNKFDVGAGLQLPSAMNFTQRSTLETNLYHKPDNACLGNLTFFLPVHNITQNTYFMTINSSIAAANPSDVIECAEYTYNERVVIDKTLTLLGADKTNCKIDGTGLAGTGKGIQINNGVTGVTIKYFTVQNFAGAGGNTDAGIYGIGGNNNLLVRSVVIQNNVGGSGFYANGPVNTVTLDSVTASGHTTGARGIVIWNGLKENITFSNCEVFNNNCCGMELQDGQASGVTLEYNNIHDNFDNGIGLIGLQGPGENVVRNNTLLNNGRFGMEIKNPNGSGLTTGPGRIVVENNNVSRTAPIGAELRDIAGIAAFRRGVLAGNVDIPVGVVIQNNTVSGYTQPSTSDGFGIVVEGMSHTVSTNTVSGCDVGIQRQAGHLPYPGDGDQSNLADTYFGRGNSPQTCGVTITGNILTNTLNTRDVGPNVGVGIVLNINSGKSFCSIQSAINDVLTLSGHTIEVPPGTYNEQVLVTKGVTIKGVGATKPVVDFTGTVSGKPTLFDVSVQNVKIENLRMRVDMTKLSSAVIGSGLNIDNINIKSDSVEAYGSSAAASFGPYGNRNAISINYSGSTNYRIASSGVNNVRVENCTVSGVPNDGFGVPRYFRAAVSTDESGGLFTGNTFQSINQDVQVRFGSNGNIDITNNQLNGGGAELSDMNAGAGILTVSGNTFDATFANAAAAGTAVLRLKNNYNSKTTLVNNNIFSNHQWAVSLENYNSVTVDNNSFTPLASSTVFHHLTVNTKSISSNSNTIVQVPIGLTLTNNTFNFSGTTGGTALSFHNHDNDAAMFGTITIGTAGNENIFNSGISNCIYLDNQTGLSSGATFPAYTSVIGAGAGAITSMGCWSNDQNIENNKFDVGAGLQLPSAMNFAQRSSLETILFHKPDNSCLGSLLYFAPVHNITQNTYFLTINSAIAAANPSDVIECAEYTYNERVVIDKTLTLLGVDKTNCKIDGTGLAGTGKGIQINNGVTGVTIKYFTVQNFAGVNGNTDAGIYGIGGNNNLLIRSVIIQNNVGGSGFYANGPVNTVTLDSVVASGHTSNARGIVIWNGLKENITFSNCEVFNNNCCGMELQDGQASGVTFEYNNIHDNFDNGMGILGLQGPGENVIRNNTLLNNGRFGMEIKNPNGTGLTTGAGRIVVENNNVSRTVAIVDNRDIVGIAAFRRSVGAGNVDIPTGVVIQNNTVSGYTQPSTSDGFGIVVEGMNHTVSTNTVSGCDVGIQRQAGHLPYPGDGDQSNLADTYFGRGNSPQSCGIVLAGNILTNTLNTRDVGGAGAGLVTNLNTSETFCSIQAAIDDAQTLNGHVIQVNPGSYNERVTLSKSLTILGTDKSTCIVDGTGLAGTGKGIQINNGVTGVTIKYLTIQNFAGAGGNTDAGIYGIGGNNNLLIRSVVIQNNVGGSGFYANGPVNTVTLDSVTASGHTTGARGIVIWNGLKENITFSNCEVFNNNCCGMELQDGQASGVTLEYNNIHDNFDNGIGLIGLQGPGENVVRNNTLLNNGRFGMEIKNPNGSGLTTGPGRIVIENNNVSRTAPIGAELRDIAGIAAFRRGVLAGNVDIPAGVVIQNNTVSGYTQPSTSDGFGIVVEGMSHTVSTNTVSGCDVGIQRQAGHLPYPGDGDQSNLADTYFGRGNSPQSCGIILTGNILTNTLNTRDVGPSGGSIVTNINTSEVFCSIQSAINDPQTLNGHTIEVPSGSYNEQVLVTKGVIIKGVGATKPVVDFTGTVSGKPTLFDVSVQNVTIENIRMRVDHTKLSSAVIGSGLNIDNITIKSDSIEAYGSSAAGNLSPYGNRNAISINYGGPTNYRIASSGVNNVRVENCIVSGVPNDGFGVPRYFRAAVSTDESGGLFTGNIFQSINQDVQVRFGSNGNIDITNNQLNGGGVDLSDMNAGAGILTVSGNTFDATFANAAAAGTAVLRLRNNYNSKTTLVNNNIFSNHQWAVSLENYNSVTVDNNSFTPLASSTVFHHLTVNTKSISSNSNTIVQVPIGLTLTNNTFNYSGTTGGTALSFHNHDNDAAMFGTISIGTAGNENTFNSGFSNFIYLDSQTGLSSGSTFPDYTSVIGAGAGAITSMGCWSNDLNIENNKFNAGAGLQLPSAMNFAQRSSLETLLFHKPDNSCLGSLLYFAPVHNITQNTYFITINSAIAAANPSDVIECAEYTYNERVVIDKTLTLLGVDKTNCKIDGTGLAGTGKGIQINNGVTGVTIKYFTVQNFAGAGGNTDAGIYGIGGNNNLLVRSVVIQNNVGGSGFYANGPVNTVTLDSVTASGHTTGARGIVIWNGLKENITFSNCEVFNNNCCGMELQDGQASGVTLEYNNIHDNFDNGIGLIGLQGPGENVVRNNTLLNNGRFGMEIKNPNGSGLTTGPGRIVVENNNVSRTAPIGAEQRDIAGIAAFRRGVLAGNVDIPVGVVIQNNTVSGYTQPSTSDGFGIVVEGMSHTVSTNTVSGCDVGIQRQAGHLPYPGDGDQSNLADTYFGRGNSPQSCGITITGNILTNTLNTRDVGASGGGLVSNINSGKSFCTIQSAINDAQTLSGHVIEVSGGSYYEQVLVNKQVTIKGVGATKPVVDFTGTVSGKPTIFDVSVPNVTLENMRIRVDMTKLNSGVIASATDIDNINIKNDSIEAYGSSNAATFGSYGNRNAISINYGGTTNYRVAAGGVDNISVTGNTVSGVLNDGFGVARYFRSGVSFDEGGGVFNNNTLQTINHDLLGRFGSNGNIEFKNNLFIGGGIELADMNAGAGVLTISDNTFDATFANSSAPGSAVLRLKNNYNSKTTLVNRNTLINHQWGVSLENYNTVTLDSNTFTPLASSTIYHHIAINTKSITTNSNAILQVTTGAVLTRNTFNNSGTPGGTALSFHNHDNDAASIGTFTVGTTGNENNFKNGIANFIYLDGQTGASSGSTFPDYNLLIGAGAPAITTMACWSTDVNIEQNKFDVGAGLQLPSAMNFTQRSTLETNLYHKPDNACLGNLTFFLPVHNITQNTYFMTINSSIAAANPSDIIECAEYTFNERVVIDKTLTLLGADKTNCKIDGTGLAGTGKGIQINNGVTGVTIKYFTVQNFAGAGGNTDAGIYATGGNNNLLIRSVVIQNNVGGSGFFGVGPVNTVTLDSVVASGHTTGARGIVIWDGLKENITFSNCEVFNNNCCGMELQDGQASGVTLEYNNIHDNFDNGIGLIGLQGPGENVVRNNTLLNNGRFGIEIKNPNGSGLTTGPGRIVVENNNVSRTAPIGAELRDIVGIAAFRRAVGPGNVDIPAGVVIQNNTVSGYTQPSTSDGFGIVVEGLNHTVSTNTVSGCDVGIQRQAGHLPYPGDGDQSNLADTYFGRGNSPQSCGITITGNILTNTLNARDVGAAAGSQVTNLNTSESFCSIQAAIDDPQTLNGHVLNVASGTFNESVVISKEVTIRGNGGSPNTRPIVEGVSGQAISVTVPNVTIDNIIVKFNQGTVNTGIRAVTSGSFNNLTVKNSKIYGTATTGVVIFGSYGMQLGTAGGALSDQVNLDSNEITHTGTSPLGRGVRTNNCFGDWKHSRINGYYTIQAGTSQGGIMNITNDSLYGETEINYLGAGTHSFSNNYCNVSNAFGGGTDYALLELKDISLAGANLTVSGNKFQDYVNFGIFSGRSNNVTIDNNQFLPDPTAVNFRSVRIDSKQRTIAPQLAFVSGAVITKNTFTGNVALGQNGIFVELASSDNISSIGSVTLGTSGNENNFGNNIKKIISLNNETTSTSGDPAWFGTYISTKGKVTTNVNATNNNYDVGAGLQLPTAMTLANLFALEDKIQHSIDDGGLGFVTAKANNDYVTVNSYVAPATTSASVQRGIDASSSGWNVNVADGTYNGDIDINKPITVVGASTAAIIRGLYAGSANTVFISSSNATIKKVTVTRDYGVDLNAWYACTKNQGISLAQTTTGIVIENVLLTGNRNAIFVNNAQNVTITKCTIENNRTGIHFGNDFSGAEVHNNFIRNNFTHGVLFNYDLLVGIVCTDVHITENSITGNWYSQVNFQRNSGPVPAGDHTGLSFSCNWYGTPSPGQSDANAAEPGYSSQPPSQFGGLDPGLNRQLYGVEIARCPYNYYLTNGTDNDLLTEGFQPVPLSCNGLASSVITIKVMPEGFYNTATQRLNMRDTVKAYLHSTTSPYPVLDSSSAVIDSVSFAGIFTFTQPTGTYYIVVKHRNSLETWSKAGGEPFVASTMMTYDFTDLSSKAYQNNMVQVDASPVRFGIYSGDVTRDGTIDLSDIIEVSNDAAIFMTGYKKTDVTGDNVTELTDLLVTYNNNALGISVKKP